jgi:hypothetical protein
MQKRGHYGYEVSGKGVEPDCNKNDVKSCRNHIMTHDKEGNKKNMCQ